MIEWSELSLQGNSIVDSQGRTVAVLTLKDPQMVEAYGKLFSQAGGMADLLEAVLLQQIEDYREQLRSSQRGFPASGVTRVGPDTLYTALPQWVQTGLAIMAKING